MKAALPIKCSVRSLLLMTYQSGQYEKSVLSGPIDSLNQDLYQRATLYAAVCDDARTAHLGRCPVGGEHTLDVNSIWHLGGAVVSTLFYMDQIITVLCVFSYENNTRYLVHLCVWRPERDDQKCYMCKGSNAIFLVWLIASMVKSVCLADWWQTSPNGAKTGTWLRVWKGLVGCWPLWSSEDSVKDRSFRWRTMTPVLP